MNSTDSTTNDKATPNGKARDLEALLLLLAWTEGDFANAGSLWQSAVGPSWRPLLSGVQFNWNDQLQAFTRSNGRAVPLDQIQRLRDQVETYVASEMREKAHGVATGAIDIGTWQDWMMHTLKSVWVINAALAAGGWVAAQADYLKRITGESPDDKTTLRYQAVRLAGFGQQIENGVRLADTISGIERRAALYAAASHSIFESVRRQSHRDATDSAGLLVFTREQNILDDAAHCSECPALTEQGWVPIGTLPSPGLRECGVLCRCSIDFGSD